MYKGGMNTKGRSKNVVLALASIALAVLLSVSMLSVAGGVGPTHGTLAGTVTDADTGEPIEGALMTLEYHGLTRTQETDARGQYEFTNVPICFCLKDVTASKQGYDAQIQSVGVNANTIVDFALEPIDDGGDDPNSGILTGTVTDDHDGEPLSDVLMTLKYHEEVRTTLTDANGGYTFEDIPVCFCLKNISASLEHYRPESKDVGVASVTIVDFALMIEEMEPPMGTVIGTVTDIHNGEPIEGANVELEYNDHVRKTTTDADGKYSFDNVPEAFGLKNIKVTKVAYRPEYQEVGIEGVTVVDFALMIEEMEPPQDTGTLTGTVTDASTGEAIEGATVTLEYHDQSRTTLTDAEGVYTFTGVPICFCLKDVSVAADGYTGQSTSVGVGEETVLDFALEPDGGDGMISGSIDSGETAIGPAAQAVVLLGLVGALVAALLVAVSVRNAKD